MAKSKRSARHAQPNAQPEPTHQPEYVGYLIDEDAYNRLESVAQQLTFLNDLLSAVHRNPVPIDTHGLYELLTNLQNQLTYSLPGDDWYGKFNMVG